MEARKHISYSELLLFDNCQWRWKLDYLENRRANIYSVHMIFGNSIHKTLESMKHVDTNKRLKNPYEFFINDFNTEMKKAEKFLKESHLNKKDELAISAKKIFDCIDDSDEIKNGKVLFTELQLYDNISRNDGDIKFKGFIDLVVKIEKKNKTLIFICDWKTCSWGWPVEKRRDIKTNMQLFLYKHFFCKRFNLNPKNVRTAFVLLKKRPGNKSALEWITVSAGQKSIQHSLDFLNVTVTKMRSGNYNKNKAFCKNNFGDICPYMNTKLCKA